MTTPLQRGQPSPARGATSLLHRFRRPNVPPNDDLDTYRLGVHEVTKNIVSPIATIVFIHGLGGHPVKTWRHSAVGQHAFWPKCWLPHEQGMDNVRICTFGYDANFATTTESTSTIADFAKILLLEILTSKLATAPLIFVCHSMGGLVAKKAYLLSIQDKNYASIANSVKRGAMIFLGTPHRGSDNARFLHKLLSATIGSKPYIEEIKSKSSSLAAINEDFRHCTKDLALWSFYENRSTEIKHGPAVIVVDKDSAVFGYENECSAQMEGDHRSICKFESRDASGYITIRNLLLHIIDSRINSYSNADHSTNLEAIPTKEVSENAETAPQRQKLDLKKLSTILGQEDTNEENLLFFRDQRMTEKSCEWIFDRGYFQWWLNSESQNSGRCLWLSGPPAAGKSVLASAIIDRLQQEGQAIAFYFFRRSDTVKHTTRSFLLSVIAQTAIRSLDFYEKLIEIDTEQSKIRSMSVRVLWQKLFLDTIFELEELASTQRYWIIDALDESENASEIISLLGKIKSNTPINVLFVSRISMDIKRSVLAHISKQALRQEEIEPSDTSDDMASHVRHELALLPFEGDEIEAIIRLIVSKSQGIFLWVRFAVEEMLATAHTIEGVHEALDAMPSEMAEFFQQIVDGMSNMRETNRKIAKAILHITVCAMRPLRTDEFCALLRPAIGRLASLDYTVNQVCPHLIKVNKATGLVQLVHETVREFLLQCTDSEFFVESLLAHQSLARVCLSVWSEDVFASPISSATIQPRNSSALAQVHDLLSYSAKSWPEHLKASTVDRLVIKSVCEFLRASILSWVEAVALLGDLTLLTSAALALDSAMMRSPLISQDDEQLISGWSVDLIRMAPQYGRSILAYPFTIRKLLPPFFPSETYVGSQFGSADVIRVVGTRPKYWDDCLAHITVSRSGERCSLLACGNKYLVVILHWKKSSIIVLDAETCQEARQMDAGERVSALHMNSTGEYIVTCGLRSIKVWQLSTGKVVAKLGTSSHFRCLAVTFRPDDKSVVIFAPGDSIATWGLKKKTFHQERLSHEQVEGRYRNEPWSVVFNKDATLVSLAYKGWPLETRAIETMEIMNKGPSGMPLTSCFNPNTGNVYILDYGGVLSLLDSKTQAVTTVCVDAHIVVCSPNGALVVTGDAVGIIKFFAADTLDLLYTIGQYSESITDLTFSPDGAKLYDIRSSECNIWVPDILLANAGEQLGTGMEAESGSFGKNSSSSVQTTRAGIVTALVPDAYGMNLCVSRSDGAVLMYQMQSGQPLQTLYSHDKTSGIDKLLWSSDGSTVVVIDGYRRATVAHIHQMSSSEWEWQVQTPHNTAKPKHLEVAANQFLLSPNGSQLLASFWGHHMLFDLKNGQKLAEIRIHGEYKTPFWLAHPKHANQVVLFDFTVARIFLWGTLEEVTDESGIVLGDAWSTEWANEEVRTRAFASQDGEHIVVEWSTTGRNPITKCSSWTISTFEATEGKAQELTNWHHLQLDRVIGMYRSQVVFLDKELWVCSSPCSSNKKTTRHFYLPMDWLSTSEERMATVTKSGDFVYVKDGEIVVVKFGMRSNHGSIPFIDSHS